MVPSTRSTFGFALVAFLVVVSSAFTPSASTRTSQYCSRNAVVTWAASHNHEDTDIRATSAGRRRFMQQVATTAVGGLVFASLASPASAGLLDDFGTDPTKLKTPEKVVEKPAGVPKRDAEIEPTLKGCTY